MHPCPSLLHARGVSRTSLHQLSEPHFNALARLKMLTLHVLLGWPTLWRTFVIFIFVTCQCCYYYELKDPVPSLRVVVFAQLVAISGSRSEAGAQGIRGNANGSSVDKSASVRKYCECKATCGATCSSRACCASRERGCRASPLRILGYLLNYCCIL